MIRRLRDDEPLPVGEPRRYRNADGYVRLRWRVGPRFHVEILEHRLVAGRPPRSIDVHHENGRKDDNQPENLEPIDHGIHSRIHGTRQVAVDDEEVARLFDAGFGRPAIASRLGISQRRVAESFARTGRVRRPGRVRRAA